MGSDYWYMKKETEPKVKAQQICDLFDNGGPGIPIVHVKENIFKCVNLIIETVKYDVGKHHYWLDVKSELVNLLGDYYDNKK